MQEYGHSAARKASPSIQTQAQAQPRPRSLWQTTNPPAAEPVSSWRVRDQGRRRCDRVSSTRISWDGAYGVRALCHRLANLGRLLRRRPLRSLQALHEGSNVPGSERTVAGVLVLERMGYGGRGFVRRLSVSCKPWGGRTGAASLTNTCASDWYQELRLQTSQSASPRPTCGCRSLQWIAFAPCSPLHTRAVHSEVRWPPSNAPSNACLMARPRTPRGRPFAKRNPGASRWLGRRADAIARQACDVRYDTERNV